ncbi:MAG: DNA repair protein RecO [Chloroflexia bacterium]|nr:DNA repair protein RecO [Chloroflexia bacterium]
MNTNRQRLYNSEGIVMRRWDVGESDRILALYTPERGKLRVISKGVRRPGSRLAGHVELLCHSAFLIARGRHLDIVTQAQTLHAFANLRQNLERIGWACYAAELVDRMTVEEAATEPAFRLFLAVLERLDRGAPPEILIRSFELHLLGYLGYRPQLFRCVSCEQEVQARPQFFSALLGGVLCPSCRGADPQAQSLSLEALKILRYLQRNSLSDAERLRLEPQRGRELEALLHPYIRIILEQEMNAPSFLGLLRRESARQKGKAP